MLDQDRVLGILDVKDSLINQKKKLKNFYLLGILIFIKMKLSDNFSFFWQRIKVKVVF